MSEEEIAIDREELVARFLDYVSYDTRSSEDSTTCPSTPGQVKLGRHLVDELRAAGLADASLNEYGYVTGTLPANGAADAPTVGFIAHLDTSPEAPGFGVRPRIVHYNGGDILLSEDPSVILSPRDFPELTDYVGQDIIVTDGSTLLGADDKAGLAAIVSAVAFLSRHREIAHGPIRVAFTPDEEIGRGADHFDVNAFGADFAYTIDGGPIGGLEYENFNAAGAAVHFSGRGVHPGDAKGRMKNALVLATEWIGLLPAAERPEYTCGYEGFYHVYKFRGSVEQADLSLLIRDHDRERFQARKAFVRQTAAFMNARYGAGSVTVTMKDSYYNMREKIEPVRHIVEIAEAAMRSAGVEPVVRPIRGGTDGARLSFMGLPCPNVFTGGHNFHGRFEYLPIPSLEKAAATVAAIASLATIWNK